MKARLGIIAAILVLVSVTTFIFFHNEVTWSIRYLNSAGTPEPKPAFKLPSCLNCNVLLISLDTLRADHMGFLGSKLGLTPNLDRIAGLSLVYKNAYTNAFVTTPSHMTVFTSLYPDVHQVQRNLAKLAGDSGVEVKRKKLSQRYTTLAEVLKGTGYQTFWNGPLKSTHLARSDGFMRGFEQLGPSPFWSSLNFSRNPPEFDRASLDPLKSEFKTFVFLHSYLTHLPYIFHPPDLPRNTAAVAYEGSEFLARLARAINKNPTWLVDFHKQKTRSDEAGLAATCTKWIDMQPCFSKYLSVDRFWQVTGQWQLHRIREAEKSPDELEVYRAAYASGVRLLDREIGELWSVLSSKDMLRNTVVIFFSDHGEELFEHGEGSHSAFYEHTAHVPLVIYHPKVSQNVVIDQWVSLIDIMPTVLEIVGASAAKQMQGQSLGLSRESYVSGSSFGKDFIRDPNWKLTRSYTGDEQLFYLPLDRGELTNLIDFKNPWTRAAFKRLRDKRESLALQRSL